ncbi:MAG: phage gp6-like head-tail connector protein, partial [Caulobacteraceae bacterium]|nr:phage gp6-like head-tail connector protein [Caulobacteraceae bacterium]
MITNGYCTIQQVKDALRISDAVDDSLLELSIEAASREIDAYCQRVFYSTTATRTFVPVNSYLVQIDDLVSITSLKTSTDNSWDTTWGASDYQLEPTNGIVGGLAQPFTRIRAVGNNVFPYGNYVVPMLHPNTVQVTGVFGWSAIPLDVRMACILQAQRLFKRFDSPLGVLGMGDLGTIRVSRVDSDV